MSSIEKLVAVILVVCCLATMAFVANISLNAGRQPEYLPAAQPVPRANTKYAVTCPNCRCLFYVYAPGTGATGDLRVGEIGEVKK